MTDSHVSLVFRGAVVQSRVLPPRAEMKGRGRYAITFRVDEYWKGAPGRSVTLYAIDEGTDCLGGSEYEIGKSYLVYASEQDAKDVILPGENFWYGWTDILQEGTKMLVPTACTPGGKTSDVQKAIRQIGKGRIPAK